MARQLLSNESPIKVIAQDNDAHIVTYKTKEITCGAFFKCTEEVMKVNSVSQVNIPLSYILGKAEGQFI
mgnify:CR=1 FL=1